MNDDVATLLLMVMGFIYGAVIAGAFLIGRYKPRCRECQTWWDEIQHHKRAIKKLRSHKLPTASDVR